MNQSSVDDGRTVTFEANRSRLFGIAYGMLGAVMDAEDVVQDAFVKWSTVDIGRIESPAAYLTTMTTRLSIDRLRSAKHRREIYVGTWLSEPLVTAPDPEAIVVEAELLSMALLTALERLNPVERAVLLLRDVFDFDYAEISDIVDKSPDNCRQIAVRARQHVGEPARAQPATEAGGLLAMAYANAIAGGDVEGLAQMLADDVVLWADGGGKARAALLPMAGVQRVAKYLVAVNKQVPDGLMVGMARVNGAPGFTAHLGRDAFGVVTFEMADGLITGIRVVLNPDKLGHLKRGAAA